MPADPTPARIRVWLLNPPPDRRSYQLQWIDPVTGQRVTRSARTADEAAAEQARADLEYELARGIPIDAPARSGPHGWAAIRAAYEADVLPGLSRESIRKTRRVLCRWEAECGHAIDQRAVSRFHASLDGLGPTTVINYLSIVRTVLRWGVKEGLIPTAPRFDLPDAPDREILTIPEDGFRRLLKAAPSPAWRLYLLTLWHTGLRQSEAASLAWDGPGIRFDLAAARIVIPAGCDKAGRRTWLPVHPELMDAMGRVPSGERAGRVCAVPAKLARRCETFRELAGSCGVAGTLHAFRRSFGTRYAPLVQPQTLMRLMRHRNIKTTLRFYADLDPALEDAIRLA